MKVVVYEPDACYLTVHYRQTLNRDHPLSLQTWGSRAGTPQKTSIPFSAAAFLPHWDTSECHHNSLDAGH